MPQPSHRSLEERLRAAQRDPAMLEAALALRRNDLPVAERLLKARLRVDQDDIAALRMLGEVAARVGRLRDAQDLFEHALRIASDFAAARLNYATVLHRQNLLAEALAQVDILLADDPAEPATLILKAAVLARAGDYLPAIALYESVLLRYPDQSRLWMSMGHALKTVGRRQDSVDAYRKALSLEEGLGEAWWSLANLKLERFDAADIDRMLAGIERPQSTADLYHLHFALGKAFEDLGEYGRSFEHYEAGARLRRKEAPYDADRTAAHLTRSRTLMTHAALLERAGMGWPDPAPIFVVGLPRSGSTLVEQILASHSEVEGTMELPEIGMIARDLAVGDHDERDGATGRSSYLEPLLASDAATLAAVGRRYIDRTRLQRKTKRPFFIDKMPSNFEHIGLIKLILPNAKIIDTRRHPMANCFSAFKQHFSRGQRFSYSLDDLGTYYRDYVSLIDHYEDALPGAVFRVTYETLINDPEREIRRLLKHCGLPFEERCLNFHETDRPVRTASSEQVRQPLNAESIDHWRRYKPWLLPLERVLQDTIDRHERYSNQNACKPLQS